MAVHRYNNLQRCLHICSCGDLGDSRSQGHRYSQGAPGCCISLRPSSTGRLTGERLIPGVLETTYETHR